MSTPPEAEAEAGRRPPRTGPRRGVHLGSLPALYGVVAALHVLLTLGLGAWITVAPPALLASAVTTPPLAVGLPAAIGTLLLALAVLGVLTFVRARALQRGTSGRGRLLAASAAGLAQVASYGPCVALATWGLSLASAGSLVGIIDPGDVMLSMPPKLDALLRLSIAASGLTLVALGVSLVAAWFVVPPRIRAWAWLAADGVLLVLFAVASATLPHDAPADDPTAVGLPAMRMAVTVLFSLRVIARLTPLVLDAIEAIGFIPLVAARLLRSRKTDFLTTIGLLSILAVTVSSCALSTTLSVMGGFRNDLKQKILGNNAHVVIDRAHDTFDRWPDVLATVRATSGVTGASPYVTGEVMVTSASNLAGGVLRGIDPTTVGDVIDLRANMVRGSLDYLQDPERLLDLPPQEISGLAPLGVQTLHLRGDADPPPAPAGQGAVGDVDELLRGLPGPDPDKAEDIGRFLRGPAPAAPPREVLPGVIVGQELARSLRLYVGDEVNVVSPLGELGPTGPIPKSRPFRVAGIFYSGMYEYDMKYLYVTLPTAQRFLNVGDEISGIEVKVVDFDQAPAVADTLRAAIGRDELRVRDWQALNKNLFGALEIEKLAMFIALGIAILVAGFCVFGTLTLMVQEKEREVGILKAMGTRRRQIVSVFMIEGVLIGLSGAALGLGLGYVACFAAEHFGIQMNPEVYYIDKLPVHMDAREFLLVGIASVAMCVLATIFPAFLASATRPVDAVRYQ